jgi:integrase
LISCRLCGGNHILQDDQVVFIFPEQKIHNPKGCQDVRSNICDKIDVPRIRFHDLRHTCATLLLQADVHLKLVQELLEHSSISLTLDTHSSVVPGMHYKVADEMDKLFNA